MHEDFTRHHEIRKGADRALGFVFSAFFVIVACLPLASGGSVRAWAIAVAGLFFAVALIRPALLAPLNRAWTALGLLLHRIVSPVVLGALFYLVLTPTALIGRALGKDPLRLRRDRAAGSYWIERRPPGPPPQSMQDQF